MNFLKLIVFIALAYNVCAQNLGLYPRESETREVKKLDGVWNFRIIPMGEDQNIGFTQKWYSQPLQLVRYLILVLKNLFTFFGQKIFTLFMKLLMKGLFKFKSDSILNRKSIKFICHRILQNQICV